MQVVLAEHQDIGPWIKLAQQVLPLFGPMPEFDAVLERKIARKQAYCVRPINDTVLSGGMLFGGGGAVCWIRWLAVSEENRQRGIGRVLVEAAIASMPAGATLYVDTFVTGSSGAEAAEALYRSCGFEPTEILKTDQVVRQRYARRQTALSQSR